jgi:hypothetical protein
VRPFTEKQIALVENFAAQGVIAIENARLLSELRQRTDELGRSVDELHALGEVSQAVNSTLDLENVLSTIVAKAVQLSGTVAGTIYSTLITRRPGAISHAFAVMRSKRPATAFLPRSTDQPVVFVVPVPLRTKSGPLASKSARGERV